MGILDIVLGRDENGNVSKINLALIALMLWRMYQSAKGGGAQPVPAPAPREARLPAPESAPVPQTPSDKADGGFGELLDAMTRGNATRPHGGGREGGGMGGGMGGGLGPLGDILGDILGGGRSGGGRPVPGDPGGGGMGPLGDILGDLLGGGRPAPRAASPAQTGDPLGGLLGGLLGGGAAGGLGALLEQFEAAGRGDAAQSWVTTGANKTLSARDIEETFGSGVIDMIAEKVGMPKNELLQGLSEAMPRVIDELTPEGHLPTYEELARRR